MRALALLALCFGCRAVLAAELELPPPPGDLGASLYSKQLDFREGEPSVPVRLMEGRAEVVIVPRGRVRVRTVGTTEKTIEAPAGTRLRVKLTSGEPAALRTYVQLGEFRYQDKKGLSQALAEWADRKVPVRVHTLGTVYGIAGKVIDNRSQLVLLDAQLTQPEAEARQTELLRTYAVRTELFYELERPPHAILELRDEHDAVLAVAQDALWAETLDGQGFDVQKVEYGVGYDFHNFEDRSYRGALRFTADAHGKLAVVNVVRLEDLLKGLVPSEIFARAHPEALKAQAVTARGEILAKIGTRHLADPYLLCSEQHCAVYRGRSGEAASANAAVDATRGQALFSADGHLVDSVYSAVCGGHTENNEDVWGGVPNPNLRGKPDLLEPPGNLSPANLEAFLASPKAAACKVASLAQASKYRWEKRFGADEVDALAAPFNVGKVHAIWVVERGVSGRAKLLTLSGEDGAAQIRGELAIRRLFKNLPSSMFLVSAEKDARGRISNWTFKGGGWGHGVGMCQMGAIGRAEHGQTYRAILRHYYNGAEVAPLY